MLDNFSTLKVAKIQGWFASDPRCHVHVTTSSAAWASQLELRCSDLSRRTARRGTQGSAPALEEAMQESLAVCNESPEPFVRTMPADEILESLADRSQRMTTRNPADPQ